MVGADLQPDWELAGESERGGGDGGAWCGLCGALPVLLRLVNGQE